MPRKDKDAKLEYQREWYARPKNRKRVIAKVKKRKYTRYAGKCLNCGARTVGSSKNKVPSYCSKPGCRSVQMKLRWYGVQQSWDKTVKEGRTLGIQDVLARYGEKRDLLKGRKR